MGLIYIHHRNLRPRVLRGVWITLYTKLLHWSVHSNTKRPISHRRCASNGSYLNPVPGTYISYITSIPSHTTLHLLKETENLTKKKKQNSGSFVNIRQNQFLLLLLLSEELSLFLEMRSREKAKGISGLISSWITLAVHGDRLTDFAVSLLNAVSHCWNFEGVLTTQPQRV